MSAKIKYEPVPESEEEASTSDEEKGLGVVIDPASSVELSRYERPPKDNKEKKAAAVEVVVAAPTDSELSIRIPVQALVTPTRCWGLFGNKSLRVTQGAAAEIDILTFLQQCTAASDPEYAALFEDIRELIAAELQALRALEQEIPPPVSPAVIRKQQIRIIQVINSQINRLLNKLYDDCWLRVEGILWSPLPVMMAGILIGAGIGYSRSVMSEKMLILTTLVAVTIASLLYLIPRALELDTPYVYPPLPVAEQWWVDPDLLWKNSDPYVLERAWREQDFQIKDLRDVTRVPLFSRVVKPVHKTGKEGVDGLRIFRDKFIHAWGLLPAKVQDKRIPHDLIPPEKRGSRLLQFDGYLRSRRALPEIGVDPNVNEWPLNPPAPAAEPSSATPRR